MATEIWGSEMIAQRRSPIETRTGPTEARHERQARSRGWRRTFSSLRNRNFRWFWLGMLAAFSASQMEHIARAWLVYILTNSPLALGGVTAAAGFPTLVVSPFAGVITDRVDRRNLLLLTRVLVGIVVLALALVIFSGIVQYWHILIAAVASATIFAFGMPARQAMVPELVEATDVMNAVALNSSGMNMTRIVAPALAGALIPLIEVSGVYFIAVICYVWVVFTLLKIPPAGPPKSGTRSAMWREMADGFSYIRGNSTALILLTMAFAYMMFGMPFMILLPIFAKDIFEVGAPGLGFFSTASGIGALVGSLSIASLGNFKRKGVLLIGTSLLFGLAQMAFANAGSFPLALCCLAVTGLGSSSAMALNNTLLMTNVSREMLGRVMSIYMMTFGLMPFSALPAGALAEAIGAPMTVTFGALLMIVFVTGLAVFVPKLRQLS